MKLNNENLCCIVLRDKTTKEVLGVIDDEDVFVKDCNLEFVICITQPYIQKEGDLCVLNDVPDNVISFDKYKKLNK